MPAKIIHEPNFARSAMAPEMSATVMIAKVAWKATNASVGYVGADRGRQPIEAVEAEVVERVADRTCA